jgi:hypothetical protein
VPLADRDEIELDDHSTFAVVLHSQVAFNINRADDTGADLDVIPARSPQPHPVGSEVFDNEKKRLQSNTQQSRSSRLDFLPPMNPGKFRGLAANPYWLRFFRVLHHFYPFMQRPYGDIWWLSQMNPMQICFKRQLPPDG